MALRMVSYCLSSGLGFCAPRDVRRSCAAANKGLIALFLRTTYSELIFNHGSEVRAADRARRRGSETLFEIRVFLVVGIIKLVRKLGFHAPD